MPRVRIKTGISGVDVSYIPGDVVDLDGATATSWVEAGMAELVRAETASTPERAEPAPESTEQEREPGTPERDDPAAETTAATSRARHTRSKS